MNRFILPVAIFLALGAVLYVGVVNSPDKSTMRSTLLGKPAPSFSLPSLDDPTQTVSTAQFAGKPWVMNVWGTWCVECRVEHDMLLAIAREARLPLVGLNWRDEDEAAREWLRALGNPYSAVAVDREGRTAIDYGVYGAPETFLIDAAGVVQYRHVGAMNADVWQREFLSRVRSSGLP